MAVINRPKNNASDLTNSTFLIFAAQYINTAIIVMIPYTNFLSTKQKAAENKTGDYFIGPFDEFASRWFLVVGSPLALTLLIQIFTPHLVVFF